MSDATFRWDETASPSETQRAPESGGASLGLADLPGLKMGDGVAGLSLQRTLGEGGMGGVHLANDQLLDREVAVKRVRAALGSRGVASLLHEARMMGTLEHPNIIPVHALGVDEQGVPALVMKRVQGATWESLIGVADAAGWAAWMGTAEPLERNVEVLLEVCHALDFAHSRGIVHRDVKPENVMLGAHGEVYLLDWGIADRVGTAARHPVGTPSFMAPEMVEPNEVQPTMDVFALGACLHVMLTGKPRHGGETLPEVLASARRADAFAYEGFDAELGEIANRACAREVGERFGSVAELRRALQAWRAHRGASRLITASRARLDRLRDCVEAGMTEGLTGLFYECRFGFTEALALHPGDALASEGLIGVLELMVSQAAANESDLNTASSWLVDLQELAPERAAVVQRELDAALQAVERRLRAEKEQDASLTAPERRRYFLMFFLVSVLLTTLVVTGYIEHDTHMGSLQLAVATSATLFWGILMGRRWVFSNEASRFLAYTMMVAMLGFLIHRVAAWWHATPISWMFGGDLLIMGSSALVSGLAQRVGAVLFGVAFYLGAVLVFAFPAYAVEIFATTVTLGPLAFVLDLRRSAAK